MERPPMLGLRRPSTEGDSGLVPTHLLTLDVSCWVGIPLRCPRSPPCHHFLARLCPVSTRGGSRAVVSPDRCWICGIRRRNGGVEERDNICRHHFVVDWPGCGQDCRANQTVGVLQIPDMLALSSSSCLIGKVMQTFIHCPIHETDWS